MVRLFLSVIYSIYFCFRYLPLKQAIKIPIIIDISVRIRNLKRGRLIINSEKPSFAMSRIGFHKVPSIDEWNIHTIIDIENNGTLILHGDIHIGKGAIISCKRGILEIGQHFAISGTTTIICYKKIIIGNNVQFSWNTLVMDSDTHPIYDIENNRINNDKEIIIGNNVWIGCNNTILKGTKIGNNCVIGSGSVLTKDYKEDNKIIVGNPATIKKTIAYWSI